MKKTVKFLFLKLPFYLFMFGVALFLIFMFTDFKDFNYKINVFSNMPNFISPRGRKIDVKKGHDIAIVINPGRRHYISSLKIDGKSMKTLDKHKHYFKNVGKDHIVRILINKKFGKHKRFLKRSTSNTDDKANKGPINTLAWILSLGAIFVFCYYIFKAILG